MSARPCWVTREETYGDRFKALAALDALPPCAGTDHEGDAGYHVGSDDPYAGVDCTYEWIEAMCELDADHFGPHEFVTPGSIVLVFA